MTGYLTTYALFVTLHCYEPGSSPCLVRSIGGYASRLQSLLYTPVAEDGPTLNHQATSFLTDIRTHHWHI
jgi:hypothetical protein